jgi:hypothetical protein
MKLRALFILTAFGWASSLSAAPKFWEVKGTVTPTYLEPPQVQPLDEEPADHKLATPTPVIAPVVDFPTPTPTPEPGLHAKNPTQAALFSVVVPGSGQVYAEDPVKGIVFAALFGVGLWQTINNFELVPEAPMSTNLVARNETLGNLFGLATLAAYGFGIQDAYNTAASYNKTHHLSLDLEIAPRLGANLAYRF